MRIFTAAEKQFIQDHLTQDPATIMLQAKRYPDLPVLELVQQIKARQKAIHKLPTWAKNLDIQFPSSLSVEQSSSETTAAYKASLVKGSLLIDLTGGFGVDSFYFAKSFDRVIHVEQNPELQQVASYNFNILSAHNITSFNVSAEAFLENFTDLADVIYLDPARRGDREEKLHLLQDCEPDVLTLLPLLLSKAKTVLLKSSPMLDIDLALTQLGHVEQLWVVAVQNEVKEVLYLIGQQSTSIAEVQQHAINLASNPQELSFTSAQEEAAAVTYADPLNYIYEPNAAIMKAGAFRTLCAAFQLNKLHPNSHLYTSAELKANFPGRNFKLLSVSRYNKKELLSHLPHKKANITVRNFPDSVASIRKKTGIKEGGDIYMFFTTDMHQKPIVLVCQKP